MSNKQVHYKLTNEKTGETLVLPKQELADMYMVDIKTVERWKRIGKLPKSDTLVSMAKRNMKGEWV